MISFHTAYSWLNQFNRSYLTSATSAIAAQLAGNFRPMTREGAARWMDRLTQVSASFGSDEEIAESYVVCAYAAYRINHLRDAADYLKAAIPLYGNHIHQAAVAKWLLGCVDWSRANLQDGQTALILFQESIQHFTHLQAGYQSELDRRALWYSNALAGMRATVEARARSLDLRASLFPAVSADVPVELPAAPGGTDAWQPEFKEEKPPTSVRPEAPPQPPAPEEMAPGEGAPAAAAPAPAGSAEEVPTSDLYTMLFQTFPVSDSIPAGGFGPLGYDPDPVGYMQVERVVIDGCPYRIQPLKRNGNLINLTGYLRAGKQLTLLHVKGDSMNLLVRDGEYVLIILQSEAADGDIVVAGFVGEETEATLKRYYRRGNQIALEPVSDNPVHQPRIIEAGKPGFKIIGVALAALTPVDA